jgi:ribonucleotide reductase beta subunit family protein with ferritin-like domain
LDGGSGLSLLETSKTYVPQYPELVEITKQHEEAHWHEGEAKLQQDVEQWKNGVITDKEKYFVNSILRLFTQSDVAVGSDYYDNLIPAIRNNEARNMLGSFAGREGVHQRAYALLNDTLGFGEGFYSEFLEYGEMKEKLEFMMDMKNSTVEELATSLAKQVLVEGVCLFASFAMLLNFTRQGKLMGMGDVNQWSIRDESIHVHGVSRLFRILTQEHPGVVTDAFKRSIYQTGRDCVRLEDGFIDLTFQLGGVEGIDAESTKRYIRSVADYRMQQIGFKPEYGVDNPFDWMDWVTSSSTIENFFENNTTGYSKNSMVGSYNGGY